MCEWTGSEKGGPSMTSGKGRGVCTYLPEPPGRGWRSSPAYIHAREGGGTEGGGQYVPNCTIALPH